MNVFKLQSRIKLSRINTIILYCISIFHNFCMLKPGNRMIHFMLHILRKRAGHTTHIHFIGIETFWLYKDLMPVLICKPNHLILNRRAISWTGSFNHPGIQWRAVQIISDNLMRLFIRISQPAGCLLNLYGFRIRCKGKGHHSLVSKLLFHFAIINRPAVNSRRCSGFKAIHLDSQFFQRICQIICCLKTIWSRISTYITIDTACF